MPYGCLLEEHSALQERRTEGVAKKVSCPRMVHVDDAAYRFYFYPRPPSSSSSRKEVLSLKKRSSILFLLSVRISAWSESETDALGVKARQTRGSRELNESFIESRSSSWCVFICFLGQRTCCGKNINLQLLEIWLSSWSSERVTKANRLLMPFLRS